MEKFCSDAKSDINKKNKTKQNKMAGLLEKVSNIVLKSKSMFSDFINSVTLLTTSSKQKQAERFLGFYKISDTKVILLL